jgi:Pyruvate/2-oxoacid:ferredoxin oxidoreductase delta subunit
LTQPVYRKLLEVMQRRRGPYAGMDIPEFFTLVEALFTPQQAEVNNALPSKPVTAATVARELGWEPRRVGQILEVMADRGLCATHTAGGVRYYRGVPFMPGIFEYQFLPGRSADRDKTIAVLIHRYKQAFTAVRGVPTVRFPLTRVITVERTIAAGNAIHTYDQVAGYIQTHDPIGVGTCYCRHAAALRGEDVHGMPLEVCMWFGRAAEYAIERLGGRKLTKQAALALLDRAEAAGLLHMTRNTAAEIDFLCNCDRWHCEVVTEMLKQPKPGRIFNSGFEPRLDAGRCSACGTCIDRCPAAALTLNGDGLPEMDADRCFGCAVCATGCPEGAIAMTAKADFPAPPADTRALVAALREHVAGRSK